MPCSSFLLKGGRFEEKGGVKRAIIIYAQSIVS